MSERDPRLAALGSVLRGAEGFPRPPDDRERKQAAVSLVVRARDELDILLIKRAESPRDPWSGHMAFPGGRWEPTDPSLLETAKRETLEETGVDLARTGTHLGRLGALSPSSVRIPPLTISSFVFGVPHDTEAEIASRAEVERVLWVPISDLVHADTRSTIELDFTDEVRTFPSFLVEGEHVWGLTHRILERFLRRYERIG